MGGLSIWHWLIVIVIVLLLFGGGRVSNLMGEVAKGVKAFKQGMREESDEKAGPQADAPPKSLASDVASPPPAQKDEAAKH